MHGKDQSGLFVHRLEVMPGLDHTAKADCDHNAYVKDVNARFVHIHVEASELLHVLEPVGECPDPKALVEG